MSLSKKIFRYAIFIMIFSSLIVSLIYKREIHLKIDIMRSHCTEIYNNLFDDEKENQKKYQSFLDNHNYTNRYKALPEGFYHADNFLFYRGSEPMGLSRLAKISIKYTDYYSIGRFKSVIKKYNGLKKNRIDANQTIYIPHSLPALQMDPSNREKPPVKFTIGNYYSGSSMGRVKVLKDIFKYQKAGLNSVVFDVKDITGLVTYNSDLPLVKKLGTDRKSTIGNMDKLIRVLKKKKIYTIARIAVFRDHYLVKKMPQWAIKSRRTGKTWNASSSELWLDPTNKEVQDYNIRLAVEMAEKGVDEIQFDYIRFPTDGDLKDAQFKYDFGKMKKEDTIAKFLKRCYEALSSKNTNVSIDIFGIVAWGHNGDINKTGQRIEKLSSYCDVISPMLYPSHFNDNFEGHPRPGDAPEYFIKKGTRLVTSRAPKTKVRPWLQAFGWRVSKYDAQYIVDQIYGANKAKSEGYLFWNASNNYQEVYDALVKLKKKNSLILNN